MNRGTTLKVQVRRTRHTSVADHRGLGRQATSKAVKHIHEPINSNLCTTTIPNTSERTNTRTHRKTRKAQRQTTTQTTGQLMYMHTTKTMHPQDQAHRRSPRVHRHQHQGTAAQTASPHKHHYKKSFPASFSTKLCASISHLSSHSTQIKAATRSTSLPSVQPRVQLDGFEQIDTPNITFRKRPISLSTRFCADWI